MQDIGAVASVESAIEKLASFSPSEHNLLLGRRLPSPQGSSIMVAQKAGCQRGHGIGWPGDQEEETT
jgi:hypothetical protein